MLCPPAPQGRALAMGAEGEEWSLFSPHVPRFTKKDETRTRVTWVGVKQHLPWQTMEAWREPRAAPASPSAGDSPGCGRAPSVPTRHHGQQQGLAHLPYLLTSGRPPPSPQGCRPSKVSREHSDRCGTGLFPREAVCRGTSGSAQKACPELGGETGNREAEPRLCRKEPRAARAGLHPEKRPGSPHGACWLGRTGLHSAPPRASAPGPGLLSAPLQTSTKLLLCIEVPNSEGGDTEVGSGGTPAHSNGG